MKQKSSSPFQLKIVATAMHLSLVLYVFVIFFLAKSQAWPSTPWMQMVRDEHQILFYVLLGLSGILIVGILMVPQFATGKTSEALSSPGIFLDFSQFSQKIFTLTILRLALAESIAIFGFVLALLNQSPWLMLPFVVIAFILQILVSPWIQGSPH